MLTKKNIIKTCLLVTLFTVIDHIVLTSIDQVMAKTIEAYQARSSYLTANILYFIACVLTILCGLRFGWSRMLPFIYIAVSVFFPLIFLTACWEVFFEMAPLVKAYYLTSVCESSANNELCGKALAHIVFTRVISALPLLFLTPVMFYFTIKWGYFDRPQGEG